MSQKYPGGFITKSPVAPTVGVAKGIWTLDQAMQLKKQVLWPSTPGAPTIGTATAVTSSSATVTYTAPTNLGAGTVTYTATSNPGGVTGTGTSPITISGLTTGTAYTFTVTATTPGGTSAPSAASNSVTPSLPAIGSALGGGFFAGQISTAGNGIADFNLVVGPTSSAQSLKQWKTANTSTSGTTSVIDGPANSTAMNNASHPAAQFCEGLTIGGFSDWYMPAKNELEVCYYNLKPTTTNNNTGSGTNTNAVPSRGSNYTAGTPSQTSAAAFQDPNSEAYTISFYWSSTQLSASNASYTQFANGQQSTYAKTYSMNVRAIRRVAV